MRTEVRPEGGVGLTSNLLRWIALITMTIDHTAFILVRTGALYWIMRGIGRIAFPIYAFLLVQGNLHTRSRRHYLLRLGLFALISEIPFNLVHSGRFTDPRYQNVFITLFLGEMMLCLLGYLWSQHGIPVGGEKNRWAGRMVGQDILLTLESMAVIVAFMMAADYLKTDYGGNGILIIALIALLQPWRESSAVLMTLFSLAIWFSPGIHKVQLIGALVFAVILSFYNGRPGKRSRVLQYMFYVYYPLHLLVLWGLSQMLRG